MNEKTGYVANPNDAQEGFPLLPAGKYPAIITASERRPARTGNGDLMNLEWTLIDGPFKNKKIFEVLNLWNKNAQAVLWSRRVMNSICVCVGRPEGFSHHSELHNIPVMITLNVSKDRNGDDSNEVTKHEKYSAGRRRLCNPRGGKKV